MRYYSDVTKKIYESAADLNKAEDLVKKEIEAKKAKETKLKNERAARAKVVDTAYQDYIDARKAVDKKYKDANRLLKDFIRDYGSYHTSITDVDRGDSWYFSPLSQWEFIEDLYKSLM